MNLDFGPVLFICKGNAHSQQLCVKSYFPNHTVHELQESPLYSAVSRSLLQALYQKNHVGVGFLPGLHTEFLLFVCFYPGTSILSYIIIWKDEMMKTYNEIKVQHLYFQTVNRLWYNK